MFPLIPLPVKEATASVMRDTAKGRMFPLIPLPVKEATIPINYKQSWKKHVSINSTSC